MKRLAHKSYQRFIAFILSCIMVLLAVPIESFALSDSNELVANGNFENALEGWNTSGEISTDTSALGNTYAVLCGGENLAVLQSDIIEVDSETYYEVSFDVRTTEKVVFRANVLQYSQKGTFAEDDIAIPVLDTGKKWSTISYVFSTTEDVDHVAIYFENSDGSIDVDDVSLQVKKMKSKTKASTKSDTPMIATSNLYTNGSFELGNGITEGTENFNMKTGFVDQKLYWPDNGGASSNLKWKVTTDATYGNVFEVSGVAGGSGGYNLYQDIAWEANKTYEVSYMLKTGSAKINSFYARVNVDGKSNVASNNSIFPPASTFLEKTTVDEWTKYTFDVKTTANTPGQVGFMYVLSGTDQKVYLADVKVTEKQQPEDSEITFGDNHYSNGEFELGNDIAIGTENFNMKTGFADQKLYWPDNGGASSNLKWKVSEDADLGNVFEVSGVAGGSGGYNLYHDIAWEAYKTYEVSYVLKTGDAKIKRFYPRVNVDGKSNVASSNSTFPPSSTFIENKTVDGWTKYRFEVTTTSNTLGQMAFVYELSDETQKVYLADVKVVEKVAPPKRMDNGDFSKGIESWEGITLENLSDGTLGGAQSGQVLTVSGKQKVWHDAFTKELEVGKKYTLTFRARNSALSGDDLGSVYLTKEDGTGKAAEVQLIASNGIWKQYSVDYVAEEAYKLPKLCIDMKGADVTYTFADFIFDEATPILTNGNFASDLEDWQFEPIGKADGKNTSSYEIVEDATYGKVVKISKPKTDTEATDLRHLALTKSLERGKIYRISYMVKTTGSTENDAKLYMLLRKTFSGGTSQSFEVVPGTNGEWKKITVDWAPSEEMLTPSLWIRTDSRTSSSLDVTEYYIANVKIEATDEETSGDVGILNGNFQSAIGRYPENWGFILGEGAKGDADNTSQGREDMGLVSVEKNGKGIAGISTLATTYPGVKNYLSFWFKGNAAGREKIKLRVTYYADSARTKVIDTKYIDVPTADENTWQKISTVFEAPAGTGYVDLSFYMDGNEKGGYFYLDNVAISLDDEAKRNFNFELGGTTPISWTLGGKGKLSLVKESYDGSRAAKIEEVSGGSLQSVEFPVEGGKDYELSYWVKTKAGFDFFVNQDIRQWAADGSDAHSVVYHDKDPYTKESTTITFPWTFRTYGTTDWRLVKTYFRTADDAAKARVAIVFSGQASEVLVDNVAVTCKDVTANMDFEDIDENNTPEGWYLTGARDSVAKLATSTERYHSGKSSLYLNMNNVVREQQLMSSYLIPISDESDTRIYEASYWVASKNADMKSVRLDLWCYDENKTKIYSSRVGLTDPSVKGVNKTLSGSNKVTEWSQSIVRVAVPKEAAYVSLVFTLTQGKAEVWLDDIFFDQVESDTQVVAAHNDFHAVDQDGNISGWDTVGKATLTQKTGVINKVNRSYGHLKVSKGGGSMRYRTNVLGTSYGYALAITYKSDYALDLKTKFYDYKGNEYKDVAQKYSLPATHKWREEVISFTAPSTTFTDFLIGMQNKGEFEVAQIILYQTNKPQTKMTWEGKWISYREDFRYCEEYASSYYRKVVTLPDKVKTAPLQITGDDKFAIYVNGKLFYSNLEDSTSSWATVGTLDLAEVLKKGKNIIAVEVYNQGAYSALLFDGRWELANGEIFKCMSNKDTLAWGGKQLKGTKWTELNYSEAGWDKAIELGDVPMNPWGDLPYDSSLYIDNQIEVETVSGEGDLVNDLIFDFTLKIKLKKKITTQLPFSAILWRKNSTKSICSLSTTFLDNKDMTKWPVNKWTTVKMRVELPDYLEDGNYTLQLSNTYFLIASEEIFDNRFISFKVVNDYVAQDLITKVEDVKGTPTFTVNGEPAPAFYFTTSFLNSASALDTIGKSGIETYVNYSTLLGKYENTPGLWDENGSIDFEYLDNNVNSILSASTEANMIMTIGMYAPDWWLAENPGEAAATSDINGTIKKGSIASFGSEKWNKESGEVLKQIIDHMKEQSYYSRIAGIRIVAGNTYEFITYGSQSSETLPDYSKAALKYFRKWAKKEYKTIENLRKAWNDPTIESFNTIQFPTFAEMREESNTGMLYNPVTQQKQIDFRLLLGEMTADSLIYWAKCAKEATDHKLVVGAYYGYLNMGSNWTGLGAEHTVFDRVLSCEDLDFFASPVGYNERQLGESIYTQSVADSMRAYGKLYIAEQDNRTVLSGQFAGAGWSTSRDDSIGQTHTMEDTLLQEKRDAIYNLTQGNGQWLFDMQGGWLNDDQMYEFTNDMNEEFNFANYLEKDTVNDIALIMADEATAYFRTTASGDAVMSNQTVIGQYMYMWHRKQLNKIGAGYDTYALSTLVDGKMPEHKINVFFSPYVLKEEERAAINKYCKKNGQINVFLYLSGWGTEEGYDLKNMTDLTGFKFDLAQGQRSAAQITITNNNSKITKGLSGDNFGAQVSTTKYMLDEISVNAGTKNMTVLGELSDSGKIGFASKKMKNWTSIYCAAPQLSAEVYRNLLKMAGGHIYSEDRSDVVTSNGAYVGVHSAASGKKVITLPEKYAVYDVFEEKYISMNTDKFTYENTVNDTHLFRLTKANTYTFLSVVKGGHGKLSSEGIKQVKEGATQTITLEPDEGYMVKSVVVNGEAIDIPENNTLTFKKIKQNYTVVVRYKRVPVNRTLDEDEDDYSSDSSDDAYEDSDNAVETIINRVKKHIETWGTEQIVIHLPWWLVITIWCVLGGLVVGGYLLVKRWKKKRGVTS